MTPRRGQSKWCATVSTSSCCSTMEGVGYGFSIAEGRVGGQWSDRDGSMEHV
jgi:hypothetical protein